MANTVKNYSGNLVRNILVPISIALLFLLIAGIYFYQHQQEINLKQFIDKQVSLFSTELEHEINHKKGILKTIHYLVSTNQSIQNAFAEKDRASLIRFSQLLFSKFDQQLHISHFYFTDLQRINLLRVHAPARYGDKINRLTTLAAEKNNSLVTDIELGVLGSLTLRSVSPSYYKGDKIGYIELGVDISHLLEEISEQTDLGVFLTINKKYLNKKLWNEGQKVFGGMVQWDKYKHFVISRDYWLTQTQIDNLPDINSIKNNALIKTQSLDGKTFYWQSIPIKSFGQSNTGNIYVSIDVSNWLMSSKTIAYRLFLIYFFISMVLLTIAYYFTRRAMLAESRLNASAIKFEKLATYDLLTKLPNRKLFLDKIKQRLKESIRFNHEVAICFIDLDDFKVINDTMGHDLGDKLLVQLSERLENSIREYDVLARFGGDEFILMMPHTSSAQAAVVTKKLLLMAEKPFFLNNKDIYISLSIGISMYPQDGGNQETLLRHADTAMYQAKEKGKNCFRFFTSSMNDILQRQQFIESRLRHAIKRNEFKLFYQPQIDLLSNKICGYEALLRWFPTDGETITPTEFIPIAEKTFLIKEIGDWVFNEACRQRKEWKNSINNARIDINISGSQIRYSSIYDLVAENLQRHDLDFGDIGIELTENTLIDADEALIKSMNKLVKKGCSIAIDDFGTGYSSLSYLKKFPVSIVKIDQSFVRDAHEDASDRAIMEAITAMGHSLGLQIIVEGIETIQHEQIAKEIKCDIAQGYFYAKPMSAEDISKS